MKIAFFDATPLWSGGAARVLFLAQKLKTESALEPLIVCLPESILYKKSKEAGINTVGLKPFSDIGLISFFRVLFILKKNSVGIIDINSPKFYWIGLYAAKTLGIKTILTRNVPYRKKGVKKFLNGYFLYRLCDAVISLSNKVKSELESDYGINNIHVIYDGILSREESEKTAEADNIATKTRAQLGFSEGDIFLAVIGRIEESKGQLFAVRAAAKLIKLFPNIRMVIVGGVGDNNYKSEIDNFIRENGLKGIVKIIGFTDDITAIYRAMDILVQPSIYDNIPFTILEAMGNGIPVVASRVGGIPEVVEDGISGYLTNPSDTDDLAEKIAKIIQSDYKAMGKRGREIVRAKFTKEKCFENYKKLITEILSKCL